MILSWIVIGSTWAKECTPRDDSCEFYLCMESNMQCGYNGYPLRLGYRFCEQIIKANAQTQGLKTWLNETRLCLQEKMQNKQQLSCNQLAYASVNDHVSCYIDNGYCELSRSQKRFVKKLILKKIFTAPKFIFMNAKALLKNGCK